MIWTILALLLALALLVQLLRYRSAIRSLSRQIAEKRQSGSQLRLVSRDHSASLVELTDEAERLFEEIDKTAFVAQQEKKTLDMAISNIAHDIRTPLTIASGYTQQLIKDPDRELAGQQLQKIADNLGMVSKRLEALMEYRRLMEGAIRPNIRQTDLSQLVTQQLFAYYDAFQREKIELELDLEEGLQLETDAEILERIVQNMLSNVLKHGRDSARIKLRKEGAKAFFSVRNVVRQPILHLDKLTNRFYSENLSSSEESSGLGLYITQQLVEILGGQLEMATQGDWFELTVVL